jgi:hypothetical protein
MADTDDFDAGDPRDVEKPRGRTSLLTMALLVFNILALVGFGALLLLDFDKRLEWSRAVFLRDLALVGLPLDDSDPEKNKETTNPEVGGQGSFDLDPPQLQQAYKDRGGSLSEKFLAVNENYKIHIRRADLDDALIGKYFKDASGGDPVFTLKQELDRVKTKLSGELDEVAGRVKAKTPEEKRALLRKVLFPMCSEGWQVVNLNKKIQTTPDAKLDDLLTAAAKRRLYFDILQPMEAFRPTERFDPPDPDKGPAPVGDKKLLVDRAAEVNDKGEFVISLEKMQEHLDKRFADVMADNDWIYPEIKRPAFEKRRAATFLLLVISQLEVPGADRAAPKKVEQEKPKEGDGVKEKDDKGDKGEVAFLQDEKKGDGDKKEGDGKEPVKEPEKAGGPRQEALPRPFRPFAFQGADDKYKAEQRVLVVCGLRSFNQACEDLALVWEILEKQKIDAIHRDRGQYLYPLTSRIYYPKKLATEIVAVLKLLKAPYLEDDKDNPDVKVVKLKEVYIPNEAALLKALEDKLGEQAGRLDTTDALLVEVNKVLDAQSVKIPESQYKDPSGKVMELRDPEGRPLEANRKSLERAIDALLSANAVGFLGKHRVAVKRLEELATLLQRREHQYVEMKKVYDERVKQLADRQTHEKGILKQLVESRKATRELAADLQRLQQELFLAQVDLAGAHAYNLYLAERLRNLESKAQSKGGKK